MKVLKKIFWWWSYEGNYSEKYIQFIDWRKFNSLRPMTNSQAKFVEYIFKSIGDLKTIHDDIEKFKRRQIRNNYIKKGVINRFEMNNQDFEYFLDIQKPTEEEMLIYQRSKFAE